MSQSVTDTDFQKEVLESPIPVLVDFWAPWCGPCKVMLPIMEELETEYAGRVKIAKMNVDENMEVPGRYGVMGIPMFLIVKGGEVVGNFVGSRSKEDVKKELDAVL